MSYLAMYCICNVCIYNVLYVSIAYANNVLMCCGLHVIRTQHMCAMCFYVVAFFLWTLHDQAQQSWYVSPLAQVISLNTQRKSS